MKKISPLPLSCLRWAVPQQDVTGRASLWDFPPTFPVCALDLSFCIVFSSKLSNYWRSPIPYKVQYRIPYRQCVAYRRGPLCGQLNRKHGLLLPPAASRWASLTANGHKTPVQHNTTKRLPGPELNTHAQSHSKTRNSPNKQTRSYDGVPTRRVRTAPPSLIWLVICFNLLNRGWVFLTVCFSTEDEWKHDTEPQKDWLGIQGLAWRRKAKVRGIFVSSECCS